MANTAGCNIEESSTCLSMPDTACVLDVHSLSAEMTQPFVGCGQSIILLLGSLPDWGAAYRREPSQSFKYKLTQ